MIDVNHPEKYTTRDGREVVALFHYEDNSKFGKIIAHLRRKDGEVYSVPLSVDGEYVHDTGSVNDLIEKPVFKPEHGDWCQFSNYPDFAYPHITRFERMQESVYVVRTPGMLECFFKHCRPIPQEIKALMVFGGEE